MTDDLPENILQRVQNDLFLPSLLNFSIEILVNGNPSTFLNVLLHSFYKILFIFQNQRAILFKLLRLAPRTETSTLMRLPSL